MVFRKIEFHSNKICNVFWIALCNRRVKEWRVTYKYSLGCVHRIQFRTTLGRQSYSSICWSISRFPNGPLFCLSKLLIISCNPQAGSETYS
jgi:hypothetical protein